MSVVIKSGIVVPPSGRREDLSDIAKQLFSMNVGDAFAVEGDEIMVPIRSGFSTLRKRDSSLRYTTRVLTKELVEQFGLKWEEGVKYYGVWRLPNSNEPRKPRKSAPLKGMGGDPVEGVQQSGS